MSTENVQMYTSQQSAITLHRCLVESSLATEYQAWALAIHNMDIDDDTKIEYLHSWNFQPQEYANPSVFASDYQLLSFFRKAQFTPQVGETEIATAYAKFNLAEERCAAFNKFVMEGFKCNPWYATVVARAKNTIAYVLGDVEKFLEYLERHADSRSIIGDHTPWDAFSMCHGPAPSVPEHPQARFGPGVSAFEVREGQSRPQTYAGWERVLRPSTTASHIFRTAWKVKGWADQVEVPGDVMTFVPKRRGEARTIFPAPALNMRSQLIVGSYLKDRMNSVLRNNLRCQERNRSLARLGSLTNSYATIDLSAASDSIAYMLVLELLPFRWFHLLDGIRSAKYFDTIAGEWKAYAKFSAMGNGFTFELESLIFYALAEAASYLAQGCKPLSKEEISVFGDDIIVPKACAPAVMSALQLSGFVINTEKSFIEGPFRESCGGDYFNGWLVTPVKLGEFTDETIHNSWVVFYNDLYYCSIATPIHRVAMPWCARALRFVKSRIREHFPRVSVYREEWHKGLPQPSYRWLPGTPDRFENVYFDKVLQSLMPQRVLGYREVTKVRYCLPSDVAGAAWFPSNPIPEATLSERRFGLFRARDVTFTIPVKAIKGGFAQRS